MCSRSSNCTLSSPDTRMSHTRHSSSHAAACLSNEAPKSVCRATDVAAFTSVSLTAGSRDVKNVTSFSTRVGSPWRMSKVSTCWM